MSSQNSQRGRPAITDDGSILDAVTNAFWKGGFFETSISDLSAASGASRASLYKLYGDKNALLIAALDRYAKRFDLRVSETLSEKAEPVEAVQITLNASADRLTDPAKPNGCLRCRTTLELTGFYEDIDAALIRVNQAFEDNMRRLLNADGTGRPTDEATAKVLTAAVNGMVVMAEAGATRADLEDVIIGALEVVKARL
ncbi:MAG: TetR/AcrR family transcriptional regulator [Pseudomonadota bacterium]